jgi:hypothetical protein
VSPVAIYATEEEFYMKNLFLLSALVLGSVAWADDGVVSVDEHGNPHTYGAGELGAVYGGTFSQEAFDQFKYYSDKTGGTFGFCPQFEHLPTVMNQIFESIMNQHAAQTDIALVLDVTGSMGDEIESVKENLVNLIAKFQAAEGTDIKISLLIYRDAQDEFVNKVVQDMTSDLQALSETVKTITVAGGGDEPEAVLDAIEATAKNISFRETASKNLLIIGDAPGHAQSTTSGHNVDEVLADLGTHGTFIIHPLLVSNIPGGVVVEH